MPSDREADGTGKPFPLHGALDSPGWASLGASESALVQVLPLHSGALVRAHIFSEAPWTVPNVAPAHQCLPIDLLLPRCREAGGRASETSR